MPLSRSIFLLHDDVLGFFPSLGWKIYFSSVPVINLLSFISNPTFFFLFCNTGAGLMGCISLLPAGLMLHFDNRSVGGTMQGWKRKKGLFLLPVFCFSVQQEADQYAGTPTVFTATAGYPLWLNHECSPASFLIAVQQAACSCDNWKLSSEVWIEPFRTLFSDFLSSFLFPFFS